MKGNRSLIIFAFLIFICFLAFPRPRLIQGANSSKTYIATAEEFSLPDINGESLSLSSLKGKVVLLNFWATWAPPCRQEMPSIQQLHEKMKDKDFVVLAVDIGEESWAVRAFAEKYKYTFRILLDSNHQVARRYKVMSIPTTFLLDPEGRLVLRHAGFRGWDSPEISNKISELLKNSLKFQENSPDKKPPACRQAGR